MKSLKDKIEEQRIADLAPVTEKKVEKKEEKKKK